MVRLDIVKRNSNEVIVYLAFIVLLIVSILVLFMVDLTEELFFVVGGITFLSGLAIFKIIPNIGLNKHTNIGELILEKDSIEVKNMTGQGKFDVKTLNKLKIEILGYDGQSRTGSSYAIDGEGLHPVDGLENRISYLNQGRSYKYEFYIETISQSEDLKEIVKNWTSNNKHIRANIVR